MPWFLDNSNPIRQHITAQWPQALGSLGRFYAMGADAYQLASQLQQLRALPNSTAAGLTGNLQLNTQQRIERLLQWARFNNSHIEALTETRID